MRLAFLDLPDERVDLISLARRTAGVEIVLVAHPNPESLALRMAEVLQIPRSTEPLDLLPLKPDRVALPSLETPSAEALSRAGISGRIFTTLDDLADSLNREDGFLDVGVHRHPPGNGAPAPLVDGLAEPDPAPQRKGNGIGRTPGGMGIPSGEAQDLDLWEIQFDAAVGRLDRIREALDLTEDRRRLLREILALAVEQTESDAGSIMLLDEGQGELRIAVAEGLSSDTVRTTRQKLGEGIAGVVARDGTPLVIQEGVVEGAPGSPLAGVAPGEERDRPRIRAAMCAPVAANGRILGVINVSTDRIERKYEATDLDRLVTVAARVAEILDRVSDLERRDVDAAEFRGRRALDEVMGREDLARDRRLELAASSLATIFEAKAARLYLADPVDPSRFRVLGSVPGEPPAALLMGPGLLSMAYEAGEPVYLASRLRAGTSAAKRPGAATGDTGTSAVAGMNLLLVPFTGARRAGVLALECIARPGHDLEAQTQLVARLARYLAVLLERSRDVGAARQGMFLAQLAEIAPRLMMPHAVETLLTEAVSSARVLFPRGLVSIRLRSGNDEVLSRVAFDGAESDREALCGLDQELATLALGHGIESCSTGGAEDGVLGSGLLEYVTVPIRCSDRTIGALCTCRPVRAGQDQDAALGAPDLDAARKLAVYVGLAWERARAASSETRPVDDPLTGLLGLSGLEARLVAEMKRVERYHDRFLVTLLTISGHERLRQRYGQEWADDLVKEFAAVLARNVREVDVVARSGSGRFAILSPETEQDGGALLKRLDHLLTSLEAVRTLPEAAEVQLIGRQVTYPDEVASGGELLALIRTGHGEG
jgi:diguanylate cyclase (GGDEF)-like protein